MLKKSKENSGTEKKCFICGKKSKLTKTSCCDQWICDDSSSYVLFSYATNSCYRNHDRYTLCSYHHNEGHEGDWKTCVKCKKDFKTEMYVYYGTNEYNFEKLANPPKYKPTKCMKCNRVINLGDGGYKLNSEGYTCSQCF